MRELLLKMAGGEQSPPRAKAGEIFSAWVGSCLAIACIALLERYATWFDQLEATQDGDWMRITGVRRA